MTRAEQLIRKARFSKRYQGYQYLLQCVELVLDDDSRLCALSKQVYQPVAQKYRISCRCIGRDIRTARDHAWQRGCKEFLEEISGGTFYGAPSVGELIEILAVYLKEEQEREHTA
mgnify:FL=1